jgi:hypothetical protein
MQFGHEGQRYWVMASSISHTTVDARDAYAQARWWANLLGYVDDPEDPNKPGHEECLISAPDGSHRVLFIQVPDDKQVKNRLHFDLRPNDRTRDEEVDRLLSTGAAVVADRRTDEGGWVTMADPEGNEFCVLRSFAEIHEAGGVPWPPRPP